MKFSFKDFFSKCGQIRRQTVDVVTCTKNATILTDGVMNI